MHFNDLMMRWRLQAIGGLAALVTLAGFVVGDAADPLVRYRAMFILAGMLLCVWIGVAVIDLFYYRWLLKGAVEEIVALEARTSDLNLSTSIEKYANRGSAIGPWLFYIFGVVPLMVIVGWAAVNFWGG